MALTPVQREPSRQRTAPSVLDRVAERRDAGRLTEEAVIEAFAPLERPLDQLDRAVNRRAFLVAGHKEADRAGGEPAAMKRRAAATDAARPPFMSQAPRPQIWPSATVAEKGSKRQCETSPGGTTSVCPANARFGAARPEAGVEIQDVGRSLRR